MQQVRIITCSSFDSREFARARAATEISTWHDDGSCSGLNKRKRKRKESECFSRLRSTYRGVCVDGLAKLSALEGKKEKGGE